MIESSELINLLNSFKNLLNLLELHLNENKIISSDI